MLKIMLSKANHTVDKIYQINTYTEVLKDYVDVDESIVDLLVNLDS